MVHEHIKLHFMNITEEKQCGVCVCLRLSFKVNMCMQACGLCVCVCGGG